MFKKYFYLLVFLFFVLGLVACSKNIKDDLQANDWNVVATNGESYTAYFYGSTVSFDLGMITRGFAYEIVDESKIKLEEDGEDPVSFYVEKDGDEYFFEATNEDVKEQYGDLTLSPKSD